MGGGDPLLADWRLLQLSTASAWILVVPSGIDTCQSLLQMLDSRSF